MVGTIRPVVYREKQMLHWFIMAALHVLGNVFAAAIIGLVLGFVGRLVHISVLHNGIPVLVLGLTCILYALHDLKIFSMPYPQSLAQVPASWRRRFHPYMTAFLYGFGLGTGVSTRIATGGMYVILAGSLISASPYLGALIFGCFGLARGVSIVFIGWFMREASSGEAFHQLLEPFMAKETIVLAVMGCSLAIFAGYLATISVRMFS